MKYDEWHGPGVVTLKNILPFVDDKWKKEKLER